MALFPLTGHLVEVTWTWLEGYLWIDPPSPAASGLSAVRSNVLGSVDAPREWLVGIVLRMALFYLLLFLGKHVVLVLLSPVLAHVSALAEERLTGRHDPFRSGRFVRDEFRGAVIANGSFLPVLMKVPVIGPMIAPPLVAVGAELTMHGETVATRA
ncbi:MAG: hypothetical protein H6595_09170 [Flavobacteriales bacterium]|nr:hypothetical protein [Flavobacteriales bacterium]MCB9167638.1 hypothetical protein [Flavobacteriales bacterium]